MPFYDFSCECGHVENDKLVSAWDLDNLICPDCGIKLEQNYRTKRVNLGREYGVYDEGLGAYIGCKADREKIMKEKGYMEMDASKKVTDVIKPKPKVKNTDGLRSTIKKAVNMANNGFRVSQAAV